MVKRLFFSLVGLGAGVVLGGYAVRKIERGRRRLTPQTLAGTVSYKTREVIERIGAAVQAGRAAAAVREAELRAAYGSSQAPPEFDGAARPR